MTWAQAARAYGFAPRSRIGTESAVVPTGELKGHSALYPIGRSQSVRLQPIHAESVADGLTAFTSGKEISNRASSLVTGAFWSGDHMEQSAGFDDMLVVDVQPPVEGEIPKEWAATFAPTRR